MSEPMPYGFDNWKAPDPPENSGMRCDDDMPEKCEHCHEYSPNLEPVPDGHRIGGYLCPACMERYAAKHRLDSLNASLERLGKAIDAVPPEVFERRRKQYESLLRSKRDYSPKPSRPKPKKNWRGKDTANWR